MFDVITFGSATKDYFLTLKEGTYNISENEDSIAREDLVFSLGSKIEIEDLFASTGGGGTNTAVTFSRQGLKTAYIGNIGRDKEGEEIISILKENKISTDFIKKVELYKTAHSTILSVPQKERTILVYRGACHYMKKEDIPWDEIKNTKWFYLAPLSKESVKVFKPIVNFGKNNDIKITANLSKDQIKLGLDKLKPELSQLEVLLLNKQEASLLSGLKEDREIIQKLLEYVNEIVVITKGKKGVIAGDKNRIWEADPPEAEIVEKTGAGDSFGAGFVTGLLKGKSIEQSLQFGSANAGACIQKRGAKNGLLEKEEWENISKVNIDIKKWN